MPLIVMPTYKPDFFEQALRSAMGQTYTNIEILVSDNCPTDAIEKICGKFNGIRYARNAEAGAKNVVGSLYLGTGEFVKPLFDDDILHPFCVEKMQRAIQLDSSIALVFSASAIIDTNHNKTGIRAPIAENGMVTGNDLYRHMVLNFINIIGELSSVMYRRTAIDKLSQEDLFKLGARDYTHGLADVVAFKNIIQKKNGYYLKEELTYFRHDNALSSNSNLSTNKKFVHCVTDWFDLLFQAHDAADITDQEFINCSTLVASFTNTWKEIYPVVAEYQSEYLKKISIL